MLLQFLSVSSTVEAELELEVAFESSLLLENGLIPHAVQVGAFATATSRKTPSKSQRGEELVACAAMVDLWRQQNGHHSSGHTQT